LDLRRFVANVALFAWELYQIKYCPQAKKQPSLPTHSDLQRENSKLRLKGSVMEEWTQEQQALIDMWERHLASEFAAHSADMALSTMTSHPHLIHLPVLTGGVGRDQIHHFYSTCFIPNMPSDIEIELMTRTVGQNRIVDEFILKFTHTIEMPWMIPGIPPTGKRVEAPHVAIIQFRDGKIESEHIYWDQGTVLTQLGLIDPNQFPVVGQESAERLRNLTTTQPH
jgi:carboxymethylenebutenolidase